MVLLGALDYETQPELVIPCVVLGDFGFTLQHNLTITVLDSNDVPSVSVGLSDHRTTAGCSYCARSR